jgi:hypothetical protein
MNENEVQALLDEVRHWLINGKDGDLSDCGSPEDQLERITKLQALLQLDLRQELLAFRWRSLRNFRFKP